MSKFVYLVALAAVPGMIAFASMDSPSKPERVQSAPPGAQSEPAPVAPDSRTRVRTGVECEVRISRRPGGVELEAMAVAGRKTTGEYEFIIEKRGSGGSSSINQGGTFSLVPGQEQVLGSAGLGLEGRASYTARLNLEGPRGETLCMAESSS